MGAVEVSLETGFTVVVSLDVSCGGVPGDGFHLEVCANRFYCTSSSSMKHSYSEIGVQCYVIFESLS